MEIEKDFSWLPVLLPFDHCLVRNQNTNFNSYLCSRIQALTLRSTVESVLLSLWIWLIECPPPPAWAVVFVVDELTLSLQCKTLLPQFVP